MFLEPKATPHLYRDASFSQFQTRAMKPSDEEIDLQSLYENRNYAKPLDPEDFATDRGWWYRCRICDGNTRVHTRHPYCRHCGFSPKTTLTKGEAK